MATRLARIVGWVGRTGDDRDWAQAALAEASALPPGRRQGWLLGAAWFLLRRRRPTLVQVLSAWAGCCYGLLLVLPAWGSLRDDAADLPRGAAIALLSAGVVLVVTFLSAAVRPLVGLLVAALGLPLYVVLAVGARQVTLGGPVADPPPGMPAAPLPIGWAQTALAVLVLVGVPLLALIGATVPPGRRVPDGDVDATPS